MVIRIETMSLGSWFSALEILQRFRRPSAGVPPLPIPNREVKPCSADGTGVTPGRVGRRHIIEALRVIEGLFLFKYEVLFTKYETVRTKSQEIRH